MAGDEMTDGCCVVCCVVLGERQSKALNARYARLDAMAGKCYIGARKADFDWVGEQCWQYTLQLIIGW